jgi:hypothetical protein
MSTPKNKEWNGARRRHAEQKDPLLPLGRISVKNAHRVTDDFLLVSFGTEAIETRTGFDQASASKCSFMNMP